MLALSLSFKADEQNQELSLFYSNTLKILSSSTKEQVPVKIICRLNIADYFQPETIWTISFSSFYKWFYSTG